MLNKKVYLPLPPPLITIIFSQNMKKRKRKEKFTDYGRRETISNVMTFILVIAVSLWLLSCSAWWLLLVIPVDGLLLLDRLWKGTR